ncbi:alanine racemase [uncultured Umboniibacter sp.]|uniref:alanine racemase n=1 Tax=uncultured Umboniibacter sp. TaxID=1798917 RepID=UPI002628B675|nr:alanine racemase [uncultured Umboniibacter sp.]
MIPRVVANIDLGALRRNLNLIASLAPNAKVLGVVKADAYGHGIKQVLSSLAACDALAVARIEEAILLRESGYLRPIVLLSGVLDFDELILAQDNHLDLVVHQDFQIELLRRLSGGSKLRVWAKFDSGMHRLGFSSDFAAKLALIESFEVVDSIVTMTHFASADELNNDFSIDQLQRFDTACSEIRHPQSTANSAAILRYPFSHRDWIRPGLLMYGVSPSRQIPFEGEPVMTLTSVVIAVNDVLAGESVGYGQVWTAQNNTRLAVIAIGYGDGYPRHAKQGTPIMINGKRYPIVGRVSMDLTTIDIGNDDIKVGDVAEIWGKSLAVADVAENAGTIAYELLLNLTSRVLIRYHDQVN